MLLARPRHPRRPAVFFSVAFDCTRASSPMQMRLFISIRYSKALSSTSLYRGKGVPLEPGGWTDALLFTGSSCQQEAATDASTLQNPRGPRLVHMLRVGSPASIRRGWSVPFQGSGVCTPQPWRGHRGIKCRDGRLWRGARLTESQRVEQPVSTERAKREALQQCHDIQPQEREAATVHEPPGRGFHSLLSELWGPR